jgi:serine protease AprX
MRRKGIHYAGLMLLIAVSFTAAGEKIGGRLAPLLRSADPDDRFAIWIHFTDKGSAGLAKTVPTDVVSPRSLRRRLNVLPAAQAVDFDDLPVEQSYVRQLTALGVEIRQRSKWFNAVSTTLRASRIQEIASLPFVSHVELLFRMQKDPRGRPEESTPVPSSPPRKADGTQALDYGLSLPQASLLRIPEVHNAGNTGQGVIVGVFDNGFRLPGHESIDSLIVVATYDFVDHKVSVVPNDPSTSTGAHGIYTLSTIAGFAPAQLIGPAYGATYILARTENDSSETPIEEDNWVAAIEWADSIGVQVTSTSLGYLTYNAPYESWTWQDMNGRTTKISLAATTAARKGIVVVNSAGNNYSLADTSINTLNAPADADSILAVGAVTPSGVRAAFSSVGPTTSVPARIKPDIMATGSSIYCASPITTNGYLYVQGTSLSCPLAAGVAAMMLHAVPTATPMQIIQALKMTASQATHPDNRMGWGVIDAVSAINYLKTLSVPDQTPAGFALEQNYPNPFNPATVIAYAIPSESAVSLKIYDVLGREIRTLVNDMQQRGRYTLTWDGNDLKGLRVASGMYIYRLEASDGTGARNVLSRKMMIVR